MTVYRGVNSKMTCSQDFPTVLTWAEGEVPAEGTRLGTGEGSCSSVCICFVGVQVLELQLCLFVKRGLFE